MLAWAPVTWEYTKDGQKKKKKMVMKNLGARRE